MGSNGLSMREVYRDGKADWGACEGLCGCVDRIVIGQREVDRIVVNSR